MNQMRQEFEMTQQEMDNIISINKDGGDPVMFVSGGIPIGMSLQEKINNYWESLGDKYGFNPMTVEGSSKGKLFFTAEKNKAMIKNERIVPSNPKEKASFEDIVRPVMKWLCENSHPHATVIITPTNAELTEGVKTTGKIMDYVKD